MNPCSSRRHVSVWGCVTLWTCSTIRKTHATHVINRVRARTQADRWTRRKKETYKTNFIFFIRRTWKRRSKGYVTLCDAMRRDAPLRYAYGAYRCVRFRIVDQSETTSACAFYERQLYSQVRVYRNQNYVCTLPHVHYPTLTTDSEWNFCK